MIRKEDDVGVTVFTRRIFGRIACVVQMQPIAAHVVHCVIRSVCVSVCLSVWHTGGLCKNDGTDREPVRVADSREHKEPRGANWRHLTNTIVRSVRGGDAALRQSLRPPVTLFTALEDLLTIAQTSQVGCGATV